MDTSFRISAPEAPTTGDFLSFTVFDGDRKRQARISGTALAMLGDAENRIALFNANVEGIREAAYLMSQRNPTLDILILGSSSFQNRQTAARP